MFLDDRPNPNEITTLWIENSPCADCSKALLNYFKDYPKPTIYVGGIWHLHSTADRNGLINLLRAGFEINVWKAVHDKKYGNNDSKTIVYIKELKKLLKL